MSGQMPSIGQGRQFGAQPAPDRRGDHGPGDRAAMRPETRALIESLLRLAKGMIVEAERWLKTQA